MEKCYNNSPVTVGNTIQEASNTERKKNAKAWWEQATMDMFILFVIDSGCHVTSFLTFCFDSPKCIITWKCKPSKFIPSLLLYLKNEKKIIIGGNISNHMTQKTVLEKILEQHHGRKVFSITCIIVYIYKIFISNTYMYFRNLFK